MLYLHFSRQNGISTLESLHCTENCLVTWSPLRAGLKCSESLRNTLYSEVSNIMHFRDRVCVRTTHLSIL